VCFGIVTNAESSTLVSKTRGLAKTAMLLSGQLAISAPSWTAFLQRTAPMDKDQLAALDRAALRKLIADTAADVSAQNPVWTAGDLADALIVTGKLALIDDGAVERCVKAMRALAEREGWIDHVHPDDQAEQDASFAQLTTAALAALGVK